MGGQIGVLLATGSEETHLMSRKQTSIEATMKNVERYVEDLYRHQLIREPSEVLKRIQTTNSLEAAAKDADFVVESVTENLDTKREIFRRLDDATNPNTILASNTSGLPITSLAEKTRSPERVLGSHFIQPAHIVPLVEVVKGEKTSYESIKRATEIWRNLHRIPVRVNVDIPGFIVNRIQHAMIREAVYLVAAGVARAEDVDFAASLGLGPRLSISGPLEQRDINGLDINYNIAKNLWNKLSGWEQPLEFARKKVEMGHLGLKTGRGYYDWSGKDPTNVRRVRDDILIDLTKEVLKRREADHLL